MQTSWTTCSESTPIATSTSMAMVTAPAGAVVAGGSIGRERAWLSGGASVAERPRGGQTRLGDRGHWQLRRGPCPLPEPSRGEVVLELSRTPRTERRLRGKDDTLDAARTARAALASETLALPRAGEHREALRLLLVARRGAVDVRREALTQLRAVIVTAPEPLRAELRRLPLGKLLERCTRLRRSDSDGRSNSRPDSSCAALLAASRPQRPRPASSSTRSSPGCAPSPRHCSRSQESVQSSRPS